MKVRVREKRNGRQWGRRLGAALAAILVGGVALASGVVLGAGAILHLERTGELPTPSVRYVLRGEIVRTAVPARPVATARVRMPDPPAPPEVAAVPAPTEPPPLEEASRGTEEVPAVPPAAEAVPPPDATESLAAPEEAPASDGVAKTPVIPAWMLAAVPVPVPQDRPLVAIIIDDLAVDQGNSRRAVELPPPLTMAFLPYGRDVAALADEARQRGHEIMVHVPMEPLDPEADPGPDALLTSLEDAEVRRRLEKALDSVDGLIGINNHMGSRFSAWEGGMRPVMEIMSRRGLIFVDSLTTPETVGPALAERLGVPYLARDIFLDYDRDPETVARQLIRLEAIAQERGYAIAIGHPYQATIEALGRWLPTAEQRGFAVVPVSAIVRLNFALRG